MSGNYGWGGRDRAADFTRGTRGDNWSNSGFSRAHRRYDDGPTPDWSRADSLANRAGNPSSVRMTHGAQNSVDLSAHKQQTTSKNNVIVVAMDTTGSMGQWREEIFNRLALLFKEAQGYLGESLEVLFIGFGDVPLGDPFEVAPLGNGPILDTYIDALTHESYGGGNKKESSELAALYVHQLLDTSSAQSAFFFIITDEGFYNPPEAVKNALGIDLPAEMGNMKTVFHALKCRMGVYTIFAETNSYYESNAKRMRTQWEKALSKENIVPLDDGRRIVDVMLGVIAKVTGQYGQFSKSLQSRQGGTQHGDENIDTVHQSLSLVQGTPSASSVKARTRSLLDPTATDQQPSHGTATPSSSSVAAPPAGTKSLLDIDD